jgi:hypothetical protein
MCEERKLTTSDSIEWKMEGGRVVVEPVRKLFLQYRGAISVGKGDIKKDIETAKIEIVKK